jgi:EAL domain-containing protein (putative c-di-GMP-specific phosphodiesterase class I)
VRLMLDDFGTGYSSLTYLKRFPLDALKVDRSFVDGLGVRPRDTAIVRTILAMAEALGMAVIAEGVETAEQRDELVRLGCRQAQGYLFARPMAPARLAGVLAGEVLAGPGLEP